MQANFTIAQSCLKFSRDFPSDIKAYVFKFCWLKTALKSSVKLSWQTISKWHASKDEFLISSSEFFNRLRRNMLIIVFDIRLSYSSAFHKRKFHWNSYPVSSLRCAWDKKESSHKYWYLSVRSKISWCKEILCLWWNCFMRIFVFVIFRSLSVHAHVHYGRTSVNVMDISRLFQTLSLLISRLKPSVKMIDKFRLDCIENVIHFLYFKILQFC